MIRFIAANRSVGKKTMTTDSKTALRSEVRLARSGISAADAATLSSAIVEKARRIPEIEQARRVHSYLPATTLGEIDILPLIVELASAGVEIIVPVVERFERQRRHPGLSHTVFRPGMELKPNRWGIPEPVERVPATTNDLDVVIVPALACGLDGYRLGYGYAYYDEFLDRVEAVSICPCLDRFLSAALPHEEHDRPVNIIVTESSIVRPGP